MKSLSKWERISCHSLEDNDNDNERNNYCSRKRQSTEVSGQT